MNAPFDDYGGDDGRDQVEEAPESESDDGGKRRFLTTSDVLYTLP